MTAVGAGLAYSVKQAAEAERIMAQTQAVIKSTGGAAGLTAVQIGDMATKLSQMSAIDDETIQSAENLLLTFKNVKAGAFEPATQAAIDLSVALGMDLRSATMMVGKALEDPVRGITSLRRAGVSFTADQQKVIKSLVETGQSAKAQEMILAELNSQIGGSAAAAAKTYSGQMASLKNNIDNVAEEIGMQLLPALTAATSAMNDWLILRGLMNKAEEDGVMTGRDVENVLAAEKYGFMDLGDATAYVTDKIEKHNAEIAESKRLWDITAGAQSTFRSEVKHTADAQQDMTGKIDLTSDAMARGTRQAGGYRGALEDLTGTAEVLAAGLAGDIGAAQQAYADVMAETTPEIEKLTAQIAKYQAANGQSITVTEEATTSASEYELASLKAAVAQQKLSEATDDGSVKYLQLKVNAEQATEKVTKLGEGFGFTKEYTLDYTKKIQEANGTLGELEAKQAAAEAALKRTTAEFIYQKLAAGLNDEQLLKLATTLGLIDPASAAAEQATLDLKNEWIATKGTADQLSEGAKSIADAIAALTSKHIEITIDTIRTERINQITQTYIDNTYGGGGVGSGGGQGGGQGGGNGWTPPGVNGQSGAGALMQAINSMPGAIARAVRDGMQMAR